MKNIHSHKGFTLVELSIALVIIGLLIGGILVGQSLVESSKAGRTISELKQYAVMANIFKEKFRYYPGDMPNAFFGTSTRYGDGDGHIDGHSDTEYLDAWEHLFLAGIKEDSSNPATPLDDTGDTVYRLNSLGSASSGHVLSDARSVLGNMVKITTPNFGYGVNGRGLSDYWAAIIDAKIDDGRPGWGIIQGDSETGGSYCGGAWQNNSAEYDLENKETNRCHLYYFFDITSKKPFGS